MSCFNFKWHIQLTLKESGLEHLSSFQQLVKHSHIGKKDDDNLYNKFTFQALKKKKNQKNIQYNGTSKYLVTDLDC